MAPARCAWCGTDPLYIAYHDQEWGVPAHDDVRLFELLVLEGAQAGLSWITVLRKREAYRKAFDGFDPERVARTVAETTMREDPVAVARAWAAGAPSNGFAVEVATLDKSSWQSVVDTLIAGESVAPAPGAEQAR